MLSVVEPMIVGPGGDLFAIIYIAKENKLYALERQRQGAERPDAGADERARLPLGSEELGPGSGMPQRGILTVTVPGAVWGWDEVLRRFGTMTFKETLQPAIDYAEQGFPDLGAHRGRVAAAAVDRPGAGRSATLLHAARSRCGGHLVRGRPRAGGGPDLPQSRASPAPIASCSSRGATASTRARSRAPSSTSPRSSAAR